MGSKQEDLLKKLNEVNQPILFTELKEFGTTGVVKTLSKPFIELGMVEHLSLPNPKTGKVTTTKNGIQITSKGIAYTSFIQNKDINLLEDLNGISHIFNELKKQVSEASSNISKELDEIKSRINKLDINSPILELNTKLHETEIKLSKLNEKISNTPSSIKDKSTFTDTSAKTMQLEVFSQELKKYYTSLNNIERMGGLVPIPRLWVKLKEEGINREQFETNLFELERNQVIDLQTASDPKIVPDIELGIQHRSRGLIYYVFWRR